ncbi:hypothetical protein TNCV_1152681 [Trichonephila clavipes]|nr:hypothetical protein TNCV_1152681 [Trichonephila clavipes]
MKRLTSLAVPPSHIEMYLWPCGGEAWIERELPGWWTGKSKEVWLRLLICRHPIKPLRSRKHGKTNDVMQEVKRGFSVQFVEFYDDDLRKVQEWWEKYIIDDYGDNVEKSSE